MTESIVVENATKTFTIRYHRTLKQMSVAALRGQELSNKFNALEGVSFTVQQCTRVLPSIMREIRLGWARTMSIPGPASQSESTNGRERYQ